MSLLVIILFGCSGGKAGTASASTENSFADYDEDSITSSSSGDVELTEEELAAKALDYFALLGYERDKLEVSQMNTLTDPERPLREIMVDYDASSLGSIILDQSSGMFDIISLHEPSDENSPEPVQPGEDIPERVFEALGLEDRGYIPGPVDKSEFGDYEYRRYVEYDVSIVCIGRLHIYVRPEEMSLVSIHMTELLVPADTEINITAEEACNIATDFFSDFEVTTVDLVVFQAGRSRFDDLVVSWEVMLGDLTVKVRADDGTIW